MNRPIKFMAWDKEIGELLSVRSIDWDNHGGTEVQLECRTEYYGLSEIDLYQFTGLLDRDGKEIYEGHIIATQDCSKHKVRFKDGSYVIGDMDCRLGQTLTGTSKIVGHISTEGDL